MSIPGVIPAKIPGSIPLVLPNDSTGTMSGRVKLEGSGFGSVAALLVYLDSAPQTVSLTVATGVFSVSALAVGTHTYALYDDLGNFANLVGVVIVAGTDTAVGDIDLTVV